MINVYKKKMLNNFSVKNGRKNTICSTYIYLPIPNVYKFDLELSKRIMR